MWAMPRDQLSQDGNPAGPRADSLKATRADCMAKLIADTLRTRLTMKAPNTQVKVLLIQRGFCPMLFEQVTATEWCWLLVVEATTSGRAQERGSRAVSAIALAQGESRLAAARRLVLHVRTATADEPKQHASKEKYFWRYVTGKHLSELCQRALRLFFASASDRNDMESRLL